MTGDTAVQGQAIAEEEEEVEYITDEEDDQDQGGHRYQTDRIILLSPRVSIEEHEVFIIIYTFHFQGCFPKELSNRRCQLW